jgi:membrane associated rhomboid family serine protease
MGEASGQNSTLRESLAEEPPNLGQPRLFSAAPRVRFTLENGVLWQVSELSSAREAEILAQQWRVRWHDYLPASGLVGLMVFAWLAHSGPGEMASWGVSAAALAQGRYETVPLHMFAHGGLFHLTMNSLALLEIGGLVTARLGSFPKGWLRLLAAYTLAGLSSMILALSFHPAGKVPMIGASGAIYGLVGLLLGIRLIEEIEPVELSGMPQALAEFIRNNIFFLLLLIIGGGLAGIAGGVAWEAHLGGFLFGLSVGPWLLPPLRY